MTFLTTKHRRRAGRAALCAFAVLAVALVVPAVAPAADEETGTIVVQQRGPGGQPAKGGCYEITRTDGGSAVFWKYACDQQDDGGKDGNVVVKDLPAGSYRLEEGSAPDAFKLAPGQFSTALGGGDTVTFTRVHESLPPLRVVSNETGGAPVAGSCWRIHLPGEYEGYIAEACDKDDGSNDGTTTFSTIRPGSYEIRHMDVPAPFHRLDDVAPFAMPDADKTLTFTLERATLPVNTALPTVTGKAAVGETLTGAEGAWAGKFIEFTDSWQRCDSAGANCLTIFNTVTKSTYTLTADDLGATLRFAVAAKNEAGRVVAVSAPVTVLSLDAPTNTSRPTIAGAVEPGQRLTGNPGTWTSAPTFAYQWQHCAADGITCTDIDHATGSTYVLTTGDVAFRLRLAVTATNDAGSATAFSLPTGLPNDNPRNQEQPVIRGNPEVGQQLTAYPGWWITHYGGQLEFDYRWLRCNAANTTDCVYIEGASGDVYTVRGADQGSRIRVEVTGTDPGGSATVRSNPTLAVPATLPVNTSPPYVAGDPVLLSKLVANAGVWMSNYGTIKLAYYWSRCNPDGTGCVYLHTGRNHTVGTKDIGRIFRVRVEATNTKGTSMAVAQTEVIHSVPPVEVSAPWIGGDPIVAERLTAYAGAWSSPYGDPIKVNYYWSRCAADGSNCDYLHTGRNHDLEPKDIGHVMQVMFSIETDRGVAIRVVQTPVIHSAPPVNGTPPSFSGDPIISERLTVIPGTWTSPYGDPIKINYYWRRCDNAGINCDYLHTGRTHNLEPKDIGHVMEVMLSVETDHGVAITEVRSPVIHSAPPVNGTPPSFSGDPIVSERLTVIPGTWTSPYGDPIKINYYWRRCDNAGINCDYLHTGRTHNLEPKDIGHVMEVMLSVETDHGVAITEIQSPVIHSAPPVNLSAPTILGDAIISERLTVNPGAWSSPYGDPIKINYYWRRCDNAGINCEYLHTGRTHDLEPKDIGHYMSIMLSVETDHGVMITYVESPVIHSSPPMNVLAPSISGTPRQGQKLTVSPGIWTSAYGDTIKVNYYWRRCDADGSNCNYLHTGSSHTLGRDDVGHYLSVMLSVETDHGVAITFVQSAIVS